VSTNIARKERSKKAMALAIIYPEPEKGGRGKRSEKLLDFSRSLGMGIEHARRLLSDARAVLAHSRELANAVRDDVRLRPALVYFTELSRFGFGRIRH
jgi:hypothetical protein